MKYLLIILVMTSAFAEEIKLPKNPRFKNYFAIDGEDSNKNNVRDDVEIFVAEEITKEPMAFKAILKFVETEQQKIKDPKNYELQEKLYMQSYNDLNCISAYIDLSAGDISKLMKKIYDSKQRQDAGTYIIENFQNRFPSKSWISPEKRKSLCRF